MNMDDIITLKSGLNYLLLDLVEYHDGKYFYSVKVNNEKTKALGIYDFIKVVNEEDNSVVVVKDNDLKNELYQLISDKYKNN
ncbi:MAG: hypothetical protein ACI31M_01620 [Bacilli bacterium]